jgi:4a-hydroxytetrahydrobiopterin dehydratase
LQRNCSDITTKLARPIHQNNKDTMNMTSNDLVHQQCIERQTALGAASWPQWLALTPGWQIENGKLCRAFAFKNYYQTLAFVNALAAMVHKQNHHPELTISYNQCIVRYDTHSVNEGRGGLSESDFICAAKSDAIYQDGVTAE